jgi:nucleotide-binding universal stress UspA family protein
MYSRILIATDGSRLSKKAITAGIDFAKVSQASVVGVHCRPPYPAIYYGEPVFVDVVPERDYEQETAKTALKYLGEIEAAAKKAGVAFKGVHLVNTSAADAIIRTAKKEKCDLIVMASHGRKGVARVLLGSETQNVLVNSHIPVLVTR